MVQQLFKRLFNRLWQLLSWCSGSDSLRRSRRRASLPVTASQPFSTLLAESALRSLSEVADDFAAETNRSSYQSSGPLQHSETRTFTQGIRVNAVITASNLTVKALNRQLTQERRAPRSGMTSSRRNVQSTSSESQMILNPPPKRMLAPRPELPRGEALDPVPSPEPPVLLRKKGVVKLLFKLKKRNYHGYIAPDDGSHDIIFHQKYVGLEAISGLERGMRVEVIARQIAGKTYAERLRILKN